MRPLEGIRVLDLTRLLPGPFATLVLADLGATVDKVEDPGPGDYTRISPPLVGDMSTLFHALNRGKRSAVLNLKSPEGAAALGRLVRHYDVLIEQFRPGVLDRLGVGHQALLEQNPKLIVCALTGYGQGGPLAKRAGHDLNYLARAGLLGLQGPTDGPPQLPAFQLADVSGGMWSVIAILAALREREKTGKGQVLDIAMVDSVIPFASIGLSRALNGEHWPRGGDWLSGGIAPYQCYATKDGQAISLGSLEPKFLMAFASGVGLELDLGAVLPGPHQAELKEKFVAIFKQKTRAEWEAFAKSHDCCLEPVLTPEELLTDPQLVARKVFVESTTPEGKVTQYRTPVTPRDLEPEPAPRQGEHSQEIFSEAGFSPEEIQTLLGR